MDYNMPPCIVLKADGASIYATRDLAAAMYNDPMFNPVMQYEQAFYYYRYLCMQMDYKIKCKEYEKLCNTASNSTTDRRDRKIE